jgi:hypothetical protein
VLLQATHVPFEQFGVFTGHALPQVPQFFASKLVFVQVPLQFDSVERQQRPDLHALPICVSQVVPHAPQFASSVFVSTHAPEHAVLPMGHTTAQVPLTHSHVPPPCDAAAFPPPQIVPHAPQWFRLQ